MKFLFIALFLFTTQPVLAEDFFDGFYKRLTQTFKSNTCQNPATTPSEAKTCSDGGMTATNRTDLQTLSETTFYNRLSELEIDRLKCSGEEWSSYSSKTTDGKENQKIMLAKINNILPELQTLKNEIGRLTGENQILRGRLPSNFERRPTIDARYQAEKDEYDRKNELIKQLMGAYEMRMSDIPSSDHPLVRDFIEDHLTTFSFKKTSTPATDLEFEKLTSEIDQSFKNSISEVEKTKKAGNYNLSIKQQATYSSDPTLLAQLTSENPAAAQALPYLQCNAKNRMQTKELTELAATGVSFLLPFGALAIAKAARAAIILRTPQLARGFEQGARALGWATMITGGMQSSKAIFDSCFSNTTTGVKGQCKQNSKSILEKHASSSCAWEAVLAATPGLARVAGGFLMKRLGNNTTVVSEFVEKMKGRTNIRAQDLPVAGALSREDRLLSAQGILARDLSVKESDAIIKAHNVGTLKSFGQYSPEEIAEKRSILRSAGFSERESETLLWKGIAGNSRADIIPLAQKRATEFFGKPITSAQTEAIVTDTDLMSKGRDFRLKALKDAGFTETQAKEIMDQKLHKAGSLSATLAAVKPPPPPAPTVKPEPVAQPQPVPQISQQQQEASAVKKVIGVDKLYDISLDPKATPKQIESAIDEELKRRNFKPNEYSKERAGYIIDSFNDDVAQVNKLKAKLETAKAGSNEEANIKQSLLAYQARCRSWKTLYVGATYSHDGYLRNFDNKIREVCN